MTEMTPAERIALDTLRRGPLAKMTDADFAALEQEVAAKGLRNLDGWFASQIRKAAEVVLKHPGHGDQSVHGGGKRGGSSGGSSTPPAKTPSGRRTQAERGNKAAQEAMDSANIKVPATASKAARFRANEAREHHAKARQTDDPQQKAYHLKNAKASAKRASELFEEENFHDAAEAFKDASDAMGRASAFNSLIEKAVEPVEKHPGHGDQGVHGGSKGMAKVPLGQEGKGSATSWADKPPTQKPRTPKGFQTAPAGQDGSGKGDRRGFTTDKRYKSSLETQVKEAGMSPSQKVKNSSLDRDTTLNKLGTYGSGSGYHGERSAARRSGRDTSKSDEMLWNHAKEKGWSVRDLHEFGDSKNGRWFADLMMGSASPSARDTATATRLLNEGPGNS
jgi:hypothetical protein